MYLKISNNSKIDLNAFKLLGASTKRGDSSKIGYFGTGIKYAIAVFLREKIDFKIFSGLEEIKFTTKSEAFRDKFFDVICINDVPTSMTTEMGIDWKTWQAVREVYCNALDESTVSLTQCIEAVGEEDVTSFFIDVDGIEEVMLNWDKYFAHKREPICFSSDVKCYNRLTENVCIYRKGIRAFDDKQTALYDYDINDVEINESRIIKYNFYITKAMRDLWASSATKEMISKFFDCKNEKVWERGICGGSVTFNISWHDFLADRIIVPEEFAGHYSEYYNLPETIYVPVDLCNSLRLCFGDLNFVHKGTSSDGRCGCEPTSRQKLLMRECMNFFKEVKLDFTYDVEICNFTDSQTLGEAYDSTIYLSSKLFDLGKRKIVEVIFEEWAHLESKKGDNTREFQNYLIGQIITLLENTNGIFL